MINILFVDDEAKVLEGLQRTMRPMRREWEMMFAEGGTAALETLGTKSFDVVVSDMRMPGIDGAKLLAEVRHQYPRAIRIVLSGHSDQDLIMKSVGTAHQYLSKPCTPEILKETLARSCALRDLLENKALQDLISQMPTLPSLPALYTALVEELNLPDSSIKRVGEIISQDIGMTAKILQMINSAFFGLRREISNPGDAAMLLGIDTIMPLVLSIHIFSALDASKLPGFSPESLWSHCQWVAGAAKLIAKAEGQDRKVAEECFTAGFLHDAGKLVMASAMPERYGQVLEVTNSGELPETEAETEIFGATHAQIGACLLGLWGLPPSIVEAVAFHHSPGNCPSERFTPLAAVHAASHFSHTLSHSAAEPVGREELDMDFVERIGLAQRLSVWRDGLTTFNPEEWD
jgi:HD-like signal output (HDOD) protein